MRTQAHCRLISRASTLALSLAAIASLPLLSCADPVEDQLPLSAALDYVQQHPEYFIPDPSAELMDAEPPRGRDARLDRQLAGDWVARTVASFEDQDMLDYAWRSVAIAGGAMLTQREPKLFLLSNDCVCDEQFEDAAFARLVRGFGNCDSINYVLAMLLSVREPDTDMRYLDDSPDGQHGGHTLTAIPGHDGLIFADAWADFGLMVLSPEVAPELPTYDDLEPSGDLYRDGIYARVQYERSGSMRELDTDYGQRNPGAPDLTIPELPPVRDARDAYLRARVFDLYGLHDHAVPLYQQAADMTCHYVYAPICQLASAYLARDQYATFPQRAP